MCKECYEKWYEKAVNHAGDREYEERVFKRISKLLSL